MFDEDEDKSANEETVPDTPLHAYKDGREEDIEGDEDKLESSDPESSQREEIAGGSLTSSGAAPASSPRPPTRPRSSLPAHRPSTQVSSCTATTGVRAVREPGTDVQGVS